MRPLTLRLASTCLLIVLSGCGQAEVSDQRRDFIDARDHGWLDLQVNLPANRLNEEAAKQGCELTTSVDGEQFVREHLYPQSEAQPKVETGFRFSVPAGNHEIALKLEHCQAEPQTFSLTTKLKKDHLLALNFDGEQLRAGDSDTYAPATLDKLKDRLAQLEEAQEDTEKSINKQFRRLSLLLIFGLVISTLLVMYAGKRRN
ncbi:hypothetical protein [Chitinimonas sp.]|uniref:hypothetical protein n=1 Tax=Chitinimonas sp. TaxID=1934313 RepID=UPI002F94EF09